MDLLHFLSIWNGILLVGKRNSVLIHTIYTYPLSLSFENNSASSWLNHHLILSYHRATLGGGAYAICPVGLTYAPPPLAPAVAAVLLLLPTFCSSSILSSSRVFISRSSCPTTQQQQHHPLKQSVAMSPSIPYALRTRPRCSAASKPCSPQASAKSPHAPLQASYPSRLVGSSPANFRLRRCCVLPYMRQGRMRERQHVGEGSQRECRQWRYLFAEGEAEKEDEEG